MRRAQAIHALARFSRLVTEEAATSDAVQLLADTLVDHAGADAVAVFRVTGDRLVLAASRNIPEKLLSWSTELDEVDSALGRAVMGRCGDEFTQSKTMPLVCGGGLFGAVVLLWKKPDDGSEPWHDELAQGLVDLAAAILGTSARMQELAQTNEELRRSREVLARTEKLRALGQMAAGVSHDLKNILNPLSLYLQLAERACAKGNKDEVDEGHRGIKDALAHGVEVLERLRNFSRQTPESKFAPADLNTLVHEAVLLAKPRLVTSSGRRVRVREEYGTPPRVLVESGEIVSAVLNLLANAADAMSAMSTTMESGEITVRTGESDGGAWIIVQDDGPGMSPEVQARVFEPFFTTKGDDGTGLGLATVYAAMRLHRGTVRLESELGKGATFTLWFPPA